MTNQDLIDNLREYEWVITYDAADRIEQLAATCEELVKENKRLEDQCEGLFQAGMNNGQALIIENAKLAECEARLSKAVKKLQILNHCLGIVGLIGAFLPCWLNWRSNG